VPIVTVAEFAPDQAAYLNANLSVAMNTVPREDGSDGPMRGPSQLADALPAACKGAILCSAGAGTTALYAGTTAGLFVLDGDAEWDDRSGATYAVPSGRDWRFTQFGTRVLATNYANPIQSLVIGGTGDFANLSAGAPKARYIATIEPGFVMLGDYDDGTNAVRNGLWWSALDDATQWPTPGTTAAVSAQSDRQQLPLGDTITGILPAIGGANGVVLTERSIYRIEYQGGTIVFAFREVDRSRGCVAPGSLVQVGQSAYFLSDEGFCAFDGTSVSAIGFGKVDRFFWADVDGGALNEMRATVDPFRRLIVWYYRDTGGAPRWLCYSYATNRWRYGADAALGIQAFVQRVAPTTDESLITLAVNTYGWGGFLLAEDGAQLVQEGGDALLVGTNSPVNFLTGFNGSNALVGFNGNALAATIETGEADMGGRRIYVSGIRPLTDARGVTAAVGARDDFADTVAYTTATGRAVDGVCPQRISTRYARAKVSIPAGAQWTYLQGVDVIARAAGQR
jgi:hypothetical protein